jgi:hypothetical protein
MADRSSMAGPSSAVLITIGDVDLDQLAAGNVRSAAAIVAGNGSAAASRSP